MPLSVPLSLLQFPGQFFDLDGAPLAGGLIQFYLAGTTTPEDVFQDVNGDATWSNPVVLDLSGFAQIFLGSTLYDVVVSNSLSVQLYTVEGVGNPGQIVAATSGNIEAQGSKNVATGYVILSTDNTVTTAADATVKVLQLQPAADRGVALTVINYASNPCSLTPAGAETINGIAAALVIPASASPLFHWARLVSDGSSAYYAITG